MQQSVQLPGVAGAIAFDNDLVRGHLLKVDGRRIQPVKGVYRLPGSDGRDVHARLRGRWIAANPSVVIGDQTYRTGPESPSWLILPVCLPLLLLLGGGVVPVLLAVVCFVFNLFVLRSDRTEAARFSIMMVAFVACVAAFFLVTLIAAIVQWMFR
ncbi:hypothetical protein [Nigerium massiliense]|uniref:hypothetical protein n=1 Tax=Nigerium massiliense TaxID=1522317 RepID=UPI00058D71B2|nr:hypothetical protein [Nigerium massiliense]